MAQEKPRERGDAAANRARILEAAHRLVAQSGPEMLTMDAVAAAAGVGKGTVFRRFGDRAGLAQALIDEQMREFQEQVLHGPPPLGPGAPPTDRLEAFVIELLRHWAENLPVAVLAAREHEEPTSGVMGALLFHVRMLVQDIDPRLNADVVARLILGAFAPAIIYDCRRLGITDTTIEASALALLRGIT